MPNSEEQEERYSRVLEMLGEYFQDRDNEIVAQELIVRSEFLKRDFTKRQLNILLLIHRFSLGFGKECAIIPQIQDFEICGVSKTKVRQELDKLLDLDVIEWNKDENLFKISKPSMWKADYHKSHVHTRFIELMTINALDADWSKSIIDEIESM